MNAVADRIVNIITGKFVLDAETDAVITATTRFSDLEFDSLVLLELSVIVEQEFGARIDEKEMADADSVAGVVALIQERQAA
ncbi:MULTISPECIES: acyl carrier protein [unclassified Streptomyces]|uniref:acyl carrier protein n=1 Tax=unclassified Streptomyces TaxID=2593676 RepID=UPI001404A1FC|nr:acyl carrier protein [Streptomyces sp. AcE210]